MSAAKPKPKPKAKAKPKAASKSSATTAARKAATGAATTAAKGVAKSAAKGAAKTTSKGAKRAASSAVAAGGDRIGRGTRWSEEHVALLLETVAANPTAKEAFEKVAGQLGKSAGTVAQKYYNLQKAAGGGATRKPGRPAGSGSAGSGASRATTARATGTLPTAAQLRTLQVDDLVGLATRVKGEIDRRRQELDAASRLLKA